MVYISTFAHIIKGGVRGWAIRFTGRFSMFWSCFRILRFGERFFYQNIYSIGLMICETCDPWGKIPSWIQNAHFAFFPQEPSVFLPPSPTPLPQQRSVFKNVLLQQYHVDHNKWLIFVLCIYLPDWLTYVDPIFQAL